MSRREFRDCMQRLAERYQLRYLEKYKRFVGLYRGIGLSICEFDYGITLGFFCPTVDIGDQILEDFIGFHHCDEAGLPNAWITALRELDTDSKSGQTTSHRGCVVKIAKYQLEQIGFEKFMEIPDIVARDLYEYGATESWQCDKCEQQAATDAFLDGANASLCNRCWYQVQLALKRQKRRPIVRKCIAFAVIAAIITLAAIISRYRPGAESYNTGMEALQNGNYDLAITCLAEAIQLNPENALAYHYRGYAYFGKGEYDLAIDDCTKAIRLDPKFVAAYNERGAAYFRKGDPNLALADFTEAIRLAPTYGPSYRNRADIYRALGQDALAAEDERKAQELGWWATDELSYQRCMEAIEYVNKGQYDKAIANCTEALQLDPKNVLAFTIRGRAYVEKGEYDKAIADCNETIRFEPKLANSYYDRGWAYSNKGEYDLAIADYNKAIRLDPNYAPFYYERGNAYGGKSCYDEAIRDYTETIRLDPQNAAAYAGRSAAYTKKGEYDKAWEDASKAQSLGLQAPPEFLKDLRKASGREG